MCATADRFVSAHYLCSSSRVLPHVGQWCYMGYDWLRCRLIYSRTQGVFCRPSQCCYVRRTCAPCRESGCYHPFFAVFRAIVCLSIVCLPMRTNGGLPKIGIAHIAYDFVAAQPPMNLSFVSVQKGVPFLTNTNLV